MYKACGIENMVWFMTDCGEMISGYLAILLSWFWYVYQDQNGEEQACGGAHLDPLCDGILEWVCKGGTLRCPITRIGMMGVVETLWVGVQELCEWTPR